MKVAFLCNGCGKLHELAHPSDPPPAGWLMFYDGYWRVTRNRWDAGPWSGSVVACSDDCVTAAKENVKREAQEAVERFKARIDAAKLVRQ